MYIKQLIFVYKDKQFKAVVRRIKDSAKGPSIKLNETNRYQFCWMRKEGKDYLYYNGKEWTSKLEALCQYNKFIEEYELFKRTRVRSCQ